MTIAAVLLGVPVGVVITVGLDMLAGQAVVSEKIIAFLALQAPALQWALGIYGLIVFITLTTLWGYYIGKLAHRAFTLAPAWERRATAFRRRADALSSVPPEPRRRRRWWQA